MQELAFRLKTKSTMVNQGSEINIKKYTSQLKNEWDNISRLIARKNKQKKEEESQPLPVKKPLMEIEAMAARNKNSSSHLDESIVRTSKDQERENKRNFIYNKQSLAVEEDEHPKEEIQPLESQKTELTKSPYSETMSTDTSHFKVKDKTHLDNSMKFSDFVLGKKLGSGRFGEVFLAQHRQSGFICALKRINRDKLDKRMIVQLCREIKIQFYLNHPNIVKLYTFFSDEKAIYLVQELCYSGQLYSFLKKKRKVPEDLTKVIMQQICRAMDYMHECEIIHRDIKPQNIIYHNGLVKICDFGWSISSKAMRETICGTPVYVCPELLKKKSYNNKIDIWNIGIMTYELLFGRVPFEIDTEKDYRKVLQDEIKFGKTTNVTQNAKDFIINCLNKDPRERFTVPELLELPFIAQIENPTLSELY